MSDENPSGQVALRASSVAPQDDILPPITELPKQVPLRSLSFSDLLISPTGQARIRSPKTGEKLHRVPAAVVEDLEVLLQDICQKALKHDEFQHEHDGVYYRVSRVPTEIEEWFAVRRMLDRVPRISELGLPGAVVRVLGNIGKRKGLILVAGRTGDGKTTTCSSLLQEYLNVYGGLGVTVEDPPEFPMQGEYQGGGGKCLQIRVMDGDFETPLKKAMRWNPRFIMVGEIRSQPEASQLLRLANSGHVVLATIHAGSVTQALQSLLKLSAPGEGQIAFYQSLIADALAGVVHQTLTRTPGPEKGQNSIGLSLEYLFLGSENKSTGTRAIIRNGNFAELSTEIERQRSQVMTGKMPVE